MTITLDWTEILNSEEYQNELSYIKNYLIHRLGNEEIFDESNVFIQAISHMLAIQRYFINHAPESQDLDTSPFLDLIKAEIGENLPVTSSIPVREFLRESKAWNSRKGLKDLVEFAGNLLNSPISIHYPYKRIFRTDSSKTHLDGALGPKRPFETTKVGHMDDGYYWTSFVYVVTVLQAQNVESLEDFFTIIKSIHPGGFKKFIELNFNFISDAPNLEDSNFFSQVEEFNFWENSAYPTLDNRWKLDSYRSHLDMHGGSFTLSHLDITELDKLELITTHSWMTISDDSMLHTFPNGRPNIIFSRFVANADDTYKELFADNDEIVMEAQTTNMGFETILAEDIEALTARHIENIAIGKDLQNPDLQWMSDMVVMEITEVP